MRSLMGCKISPKDKVWIWGQHTNLVRYQYVVLQEWLDVTVKIVDAKDSRLGAPALPMRSQFPHSIALCRSYKYLTFIFSITAKRNSEKTTQRLDRRCPRNTNLSIPTPPKDITANHIRTPKPEHCLNVPCTTAVALRQLLAELGRSPALSKPTSVVDHASLSPRLPGVNLQPLYISNIYPPYRLLDECLERPNASRMRVPGFR